MFFICCRWTPPDELYSITDFFFDVRNGGLYELIGIHEVSTFDLRKKISCSRLLSFFTAHNKCRAFTMLPFCKNLCFVQGDVPFEPDARSLGFLSSRGPMSP
jgi:hypothetical protein